MHRQWLKNLATSEFSNGSWQLSDPSNPSYLAHTAFQDALDSLYGRVENASDIFNTYADPLKQIKLYKLTTSKHTSPCGFIMLMNKLQLKLDKQQSAFKTEIIYFHNYKNLVKPLRIYIPKMDTFGDVIWMENDKTPMDLNHIAKQLIEDLCRQAYELGLIPITQRT